MSREEALELLHDKLKNRNLRRHVYAVEAVMRALARRLGGDEEIWSLAGLLHDLDYELTLEDPERHTKITCEWLKERGGVSEEILRAIQAHVGNVPRNEPIEKAIYCADPATGFLVACALMHPDKKLASLDLSFIQRRFKEKRFAAGANREQMAACGEVGLDLDEFLLLAKDAMAGIAGELGL